MIIKFKFPDSVPRDQINEEFIQGMLDRMATSFFKYGPMRNTLSDGLKNSEERVKIYKRTGNTEGLVDAANFLMIEFTLPRHRDSHFQSTSSSESPGRILVTGERVHGKTEKKTRIQREGD